MRVADGYVDIYLDIMDMQGGPSVRGDFLDTYFLLLHMCGVPCAYLPGTSCTCYVPYSNVSNPTTETKHRNELETGNENPPRQPHSTPPATTTTTTNPATYGPLFHRPRPV